MQSNKSSMSSKAGKAKLAVNGKIEFIREELVANQNTPRNTFADGSQPKRAKTGCVGNCLKMCCETKMKSQEEIYRDTKAY